MFVTGKGRRWEERGQVTCRVREKERVWLRYEQLSSQIKVEQLLRMLTLRVLCLSDWIA